MSSLKCHAARRHKHHITDVKQMPAFGISRLEHATQCYQPLLPALLLSDKLVMRKIFFDDSRHVVGTPKLGGVKGAARA